jgi:hypothetical protein
MFAREYYYKNSVVAFFSISCFLFVWDEFMRSFWGFDGRVFELVNDVFPLLVSSRKFVMNWAMKKKWNLEESLKKIT